MCHVPSQPPSLGRACSHHGPFAFEKATPGCTDPYEAPWLDHLGSESLDKLLSQGPPLHRGHDEPPSLEDLGENEGAGFHQALNQSSEHS